MTIRLLVFSLLASLPACAPMPPFTIVGADPSDPHAGIRPGSYSPVTAGYAGRRPVEPAAWDQTNRSVAPDS